jgi:hypothetical protein
MMTIVLSMDDKERHLFLFGNSMMRGEQDYGRFLG